MVVIVYVIFCMDFKLVDCVGVIYDVCEMLRFVFDIVILWELFKILVKYGEFFY